MDYSEFEKYVADYAEGTLDDDLRRRMDRAREADPRCDELARVHEQILSALEETPELEAPAGLAERIMAEASLRERLAAVEQKAYRRGIGIGIAAAAFSAVSLALVLWMVDFSTGTATLDTLRTAGSGLLAQVSLYMLGWVDAAGAALQAKVAIPLVHQSMPLYIVLLSLIASGILAFFRNEIMAAVDSF